MPNFHGKNARFLMNGRELGDQVTGLEASITTDTAETTAFGANAKTYLAGPGDGSMSVQALFADGDASLSKRLADDLAANGVATATCLPGGTDYPVSIVEGNITNITYTSPISDVVRMTFDLTGQNAVQTPSGIQYRSLLTHGHLVFDDDLTASGNKGPVLDAGIFSLPHTGTVISVMHGLGYGPSCRIKLSSSTSSNFTSPTDHVHTVAGTFHNNPHARVDVFTGIERYIQVSWSNFVGGGNTNNLSVIIHRG